MNEARLQTHFHDDALAGLRARLGSLPRRRLRGEARRAGVLVPLCHVSGRACFLFTRRSERVGTHKGQVSFPGGMLDDHDANIEACALRELEEELGVPSRQVEVLGCFHDVQAITGVHVTPVLGFLGEVSLDELRPSPAEIDGVFALSLDELVGPGRHYVQDYGPRGQLPVFPAGPWPVWGLTAHILRGVLEEVLGLSLPAAEVRRGAPLP